MNGIVAVAAMLRAALGVHEIRAHRSLSLSLSLPFSPHLSLSIFLSIPPFGLSLLLSTLQLTSLVPPTCSLPPLGTSRIETLCRVASGITMNLHSFELGTYCAALIYAKHLLNIPA